MTSHPSGRVTIAKNASSGEDEISDEDDNPEGLGVEDQQEQEPPRVKPIRIPPRVQIPLSPSLSISTTVSELELEQGEALLRVKRMRPKEELDDLIPPTEDESDKPAPKKRKTNSKGTKYKGKKKGNQVRGLTLMRCPPDKIAFGRENSSCFRSREGWV